MRTAIARFPGGYPAVAEQLGLKLTYTPRTRPVAAAQFETELLAFIQEHGEPGIMPSETTLLEAGRNDLVLATRRAGGFVTMAKKLDLKTVRQGWISAVSLKEIAVELAPYITKGARPIPPLKAFRKAGREDLVKKIKLAGGWSVVSRQLKTKLRS